MNKTGILSTTFGLNKALGSVCMSVELREKDGGGARQTHPVKRTGKGEGGRTETDRHTYRRTDRQTDQ